MRKLILMAPIVFVLLLSSVSATLIFGTVYSEDGSQEIADSNVEVECDGITRDALTDSDDGDYMVAICRSDWIGKPLMFLPCMFDNTVCDDGSEVKVYAEKEGMTGYATGYVMKNGQCHDCGNDCDDQVCDCRCGFPGARIDVNMGEEIPEFSAIAAGLALLGSGAGFYMLRRKK